MYTTRKSKHLSQMAVMRIKQNIHKGLRIVSVTQLVLWPSVERQQDLRSKFHSNDLRVNGEMLRIAKRVCIYEAEKGVVHKLKWL